MTMEILVTILQEEGTQPWKEVLWFKKKKWAKNLVDMMLVKNIENNINTV